jgi:GH43 family beta-xylosidase
MVLAMSSQLPSAGSSAFPATFRNPIKLGADPWLTYYDGWYYLSTTDGVDVRIRRAKRLGELKDARDQVVWKDDDRSRNRDIWAPEFHMFDGGDGPRWYLYYTATHGPEPGHRIYVAESEGKDPMGPYHFKAKLLTDPKDEHYAIDLHPVKLPDGRMYAIWCGRPSPAGQGLYIARMSNPWTIEGRRQYLDVSGLGCDVVREGPVTLQRDGKVFLIYSVCAADTPDYRLGMTIADAKSDLLDPASWRQHPKAVFQRADDRGVYGPGHNFFFKSPDGKEDWIAYHAKPGTKITYGDRSTRVQKFTWTPEGLPDFGIPVSVDTEIAAPSGE